VSTTIGHMGVSNAVGVANTGTRARHPDESGVVERDGVRIAYEVFNPTASATVVLLPAWSIVSSRVFKGQVAFLARHLRVVTFDNRGNGLSDRPDDAAAYANAELLADALAVLDATGTARACLVGFSASCYTALRLAVAHPERVAGAFLIAVDIPHLAPAPSDWIDFDAIHEQHPTVLEKYNRHYWQADYPGWLQAFFETVFCEPHSTKQIDDAVAWGLDTDARTLIHTVDGSAADDPTQADAEALCRAVGCPVSIVHGTDDLIDPLAIAQRAAELTGADFLVVEGGGHAPLARDPVPINLRLREFALRVLDAAPPARETFTRARQRTKRALYVSSPIGLGHAWRDIAIADELRRQAPGLEIEWLAQAPVTRVLAARGETIHPASAELASEDDHITSEAGTHDLHAFDALRRMDEIFCANYMLFDDVVREDAYDLWIGDEAWEVDHFLHDNPERKIAPYVWLSDFVGYLPMAAGGEREAALTADYNAEMIEQVQRHPQVRDRSIFVGSPGDIVADAFGPGLPSIRDWTMRQFEFAGYIPGFDPATLGERAALRTELGYGDEPLLLVSVGGSGVGGAMLHRAVAALPALRERIPDLRTLAVTGPGIDPATVAAADGLEVRGYVHELYRHLAACDVGLVQGGLTTTMELVAAGRPFVSLPLASHFEQRYHVRHRLDRYGATHWLEYADATPDAIADAVAAALLERPDYRRVDFSGPARAAAMIAELL
jgi:pimeloyl-ACP methyl ester carboxylesterase/predicted glycosyltransferase